MGNYTAFVYQYNKGKVLGKKSFYLVREPIAKSCNCPSSTRHLVFNANPKQ